MNNFINIIQNIVNIISSKQFLLLVEIIACTVVLTIGFSITTSYIKQSQKKRINLPAFYFLLLIIISVTIENIAWIFELFYKLKNPLIPEIYLQIIILTAWVFNIILYQSLGLFIEHIIENQLILRLHQKIFFIWNSIFIPIFIHTVYCHIINIPHRYIAINTVFRIASVSQFVFLMPSIIVAIHALYYKNIPSILKKQLSLFLHMIILPLIISDIIQCLPIFYEKNSNIDLSGLIASISTALMTAAIIFCSQNLIRFRFFNLSTKVQDKQIADLGDNFKDAIEHVSFAKTQDTLTYITQMFFKENFNVPIEHVYLHFRFQQENCSRAGIDNNFCNMIINSIESFINKDEQSSNLLQQYRILVADEIAFDAYYHEQENEITLVTFLKNIDSEIFLPIYDCNIIIAYLVVRKNEKHGFYNLNEQNKIVIFGTFLASAINIMHNNNTATLYHENKKIKEELYLKHQEVNQYKESMRVLLKQKSNSHVGIILYKDDRFTFGNETAQNLLPINLNYPRKHPAAIALTRLVKQVESFRTLQTKILYDNHNKQLLVTGVPHLDYQGGVILTLHYLDSSDTIKTYIDTLYDPSQIDYLLYLETTKSGKLINEIIPSTNETFLHFKITLLKIALSKKATLLESNNEDVQAIVEIIHHISLRTNLHILDLKPTTMAHDLSIKLFGLNPLLTAEKEEALLSTLNQKGTLFIKNIDFLDIDTQNKLAEFIKYGMFTILKSEQKIFADVRIICSVSQDPQILINQNKLSPLLFEQLAETSLKIPVLMNMETEELKALIDQIACQVTENNHFINLLEISDKEKDEIINNRPTSFQAFKLHIQQVLNKKSREYTIEKESDYHGATHVTDPKLLKASNLGKQALKDAEVMSMLWSQFHCQNKIAQFLGVNRSSVQRRCKEYNLY